VPNNIQIQPSKLGGLPIALSVMDSLKIREFFSKFIQDDPRDMIPASESLMVILSNVVMERFPLYKMKEWAEDRPLLPSGKVRYLNDDRVGRALHRLFKADRASLLTSVVLEAIKFYELNTQRVHNDSTTVKLFGEYAIPHKAAKPKRGHSKDHRPDLKQLLFNLSVLGDEAVPLYFKVFDGNTADEKTHLKNWMAIRGLLNKQDFIYVADCKLCVRESMEFIDQEGGRFVTVLPETRSEDKKFKDWIQDHAPDWVLAKEMPPRKQSDPSSLWWTFECPYPSKEGFRIIWIKSSDKQKIDEQKRTSVIDDTFSCLEEVSQRIHRNRQKLTQAVENIFEEKRSEKYFHWKITLKTEENYKQAHMGRPTADTKYRKVQKKRYVLTFLHNQEKIRYDAKCDGLFPLITNLKLQSREVLEIYKFQPRLEKRHQQLKSVYYVAPVFLKHPERIEALLFLYFLGLLVTSLIERKVRLAMRKSNLTSIPIYPEKRACRYPTADKILALFQDVRVQTVAQNGKMMAEVPDRLSQNQKLILQLLDLSPDQFFRKRQV